MTDIEKLKQWIDGEIERLRKDFSSAILPKEVRQESYRKRTIYADLKNQIDKLLLK